MSRKIPAGRATLENTDTLIVCHEEGTCWGDVCAIHKKTDHVMRSFSQHWRSDRQIMERICPCGCGHPDPDDFKVRANPYEAIHGCCAEQHCQEPTTN